MVDWCIGRACSDVWIDGWLDGLVSDIAGGQLVRWFISWISICLFVRLYVLRSNSAPIFKGNTLPYVKKDRIIRGVSRARKWERGNLKSDPGLVLASSFFFVSQLLLQPTLTPPTLASFKNKSFWTPTKKHDNALSSCWDSFYTRPLP